MNLSGYLEAELQNRHDNTDNDKDNNRVETPKVCRPKESVEIHVSLKLKSPMEAACNVYIA